MSPQLDLWSDASDVGWGAHLGDDFASGLWSPADLEMSINARELLAIERALEILCSTFSEFLCRSVRGQLYRNSLSRESRGHSVSAAECHCAVDFALGGVSSGDLSSPIYHGSPQRPCGLPVSAQPSLGLRVDPQDRGISGAAEEVACDQRPVCHLSQSPRFNIFFSVPPSERLGDRCSAPELEWVAGVCLSALSFIPAVLEKLRS